MAYATAMQAPHPPLREYYTQEAERRGWVRQIFDRTAGDYDRIERVMALGSGSWYRRKALRRAAFGWGCGYWISGWGPALRPSRRLSWLVYLATSPASIPARE